MQSINVSHLSKFYPVHQKEPGLIGSIKSLVHRQYRQVKAVDEISFSIEQGELIGFIGPNGAGKTTTLKCLSGLLYPTEGRVKVLGVTPWERKPDFLRQISLVMGQKNQLWWDLPAIESFNLNKEIYEIPDKAYKKTLSTLVELLDVSSILNVQVRKLSLGQRMKCELIAALLHSPKVLFLDEPTIGLDVVMQKTMRDFVSNYNKHFNATIILTSHYMDDVKELTKRVIVIDDGHILYDGLLSDVITKYARNKIITVVFAKELSMSKLTAFGELKSFEYPTAKLEVKRKEAAGVAAKLLEVLPVADLTIEEPPIEAIIREVFTGKMRENE